MNEWRETDSAIIFAQLKVLLFNDLFCFVLRNVFLCLCVCLADPAFFAGRCAEIVLVRKEKEQVVGTFGILHPDVLRAYDLLYPCSAIEMELEPLL